ILLVGEPPVLARGVVAGGEPVVVVGGRALLGRRAGDVAADGDQDHPGVGGDRERRGAGAGQGRRRRPTAGGRGEGGEREARGPGARHGFALARAIAPSTMRASSGRYSG